VLEVASASRSVQCAALPLADSVAGADQIAQGVLTIPEPPKDAKIRVHVGAADEISLSGHDLVHLSQ
jgi:hypothetical protein